MNPQGTRRGTRKGSASPQGAARGARKNKPPNAARKGDASTRLDSAPEETPEIAPAAQASPAPGNGAADGPVTDHDPLATPPLPQQVEMEMEAEVEVEVEVEAVSDSDAPSADAPAPPPAEEAGTSPEASPETPPAAAAEPAPQQEPTCADLPTVSLHRTPPRLATEVKLTDTSKAGEDRWKDLLRSTWVRPPATPRVGDSPQSASEPHRPPRGFRAFSPSDLKILFAPSFSPRGDLAGARTPTAEEQQLQLVETVSVPAMREPPIRPVDTGREMLRPPQPQAQPAPVAPPEVTELVEAWRQEIQRDKPAPVRRVAMPRIDEVVSAPAPRAKAPAVKAASPDAAPATVAATAKSPRLPPTPAPTPTPTPAASPRAGSPRLVIDFGALCSTAVTITTEAPHIIRDCAPIVQAAVTQPVETPRMPVAEAPPAQIHQAWQRFEAKVSERPAPAAPAAPPVAHLPRTAAAAPRPQPAKAPEQPPAAHPRPTAAAAAAAEAPKRQVVAVENIVSGAFRAIADAGSWIFGRAKTPARSEPVPPKPAQPRPQTPPRPAPSREETSRPKQRFTYSATAAIAASRRGRERTGTPGEIQRKPKMDVHR